MQTRLPRGFFFGVRDANELVLVSVLRCKIRFQEDARLLQKLVSERDISSEFAH